MVKVNVKESQITIKTCYEDCLVSDLDRFVTYEEREKGLIEVFTDFNYSDYLKLTPGHQLAILTLLDFLDEKEPVNIPEPEFKIEVGDESFFKIERAKQILESGNHLFILPNLARLYLGDEWVNDLNNNVLKVFAHSLQIFDSLQLFFERHSDLSESEPDTEDQQEAGIESLRSFGSFGLVYNLAKGNPLKFDKLLKLPAETVYMTLRYSKAESLYKDNLVKIDKRKNAHLSKNR